MVNLCITIPNAWREPRPSPLSRHVGDQWCGVTAHRVQAWALLQRILQTVDLFDHRVGGGNRVNAVGTADRHRTAAGPAGRTLVFLGALRWAIIRAIDITL